MNHVTIIGRLARDPEARTTQGGVSTSTMTVAVNRRYRNKDGQYDADFLPVVAWRQTADYCNRYLRKGSKVAVEGSIQTRNYTAQDGSKRYVTEIIADHVEGLDSRNADGNSATTGNAAPQQSQDAGKDDFTEVMDEDLPF
jgi:single-strand DNA-binding protein